MKRMLKKILVFMVICILSAGMETTFVKASGKVDNEILPYAY